MTGASRKVAIAARLLGRTKGGDAGRKNIESNQLGERPNDPAADTNRSSDTARLAAIAQAEYASRRRRDQMFRADVFAEPAWDMLLDLYIQRHKARAVSVHSLCIAAAVPTTTALRWIGKLDTAGLLLRRPSLNDNRVIHVSLSDDAVAVMEDYLRSQLGNSASASGPQISFS